MSLLMDALKKAERDKEQLRDDEGGREGAGATPSNAPSSPAERADGDIDAPSSHADHDEFRLGDLTVSPSSVDEDTPSTDADELTPPASPKLELELERLDDTTEDVLGDLEIPADAEQEILNSALNATDEKDSTIARAGRATVASASSDLSQAATMPSIRAAEGSVKAYFDDQEDRRRDSEDLGSILLAKPLNDTSQVTAETVFHAGRGVRASSKVIGLVIGAVSLIALFLAAIGIYYYQLTPTPRPIIDPIVESRIESSAVPFAAGSGQAAVVPGDAQTFEGEGATQAISPDLPTEKTPGHVHTLASESDGGGVTNASSDPSTVTPSDRTAGGSTVAQTAPGSTPTVADESVADAPPAAKLPPPVARFSRASDLSIAKRSRSDSLNQTLEQAYLAVRGGDLAQATRQYGEVLSKQPKQRDALLGLAAIALARGDHAAAYDRYAEVLDEYPGDELAVAGIFTLADGQVRGASAADLKVMLDDARDPAPIHFALGRFYARQQRWADAQESFFSAFAAASDHPDYCYNLAVSLDKLGQVDAARRYYQTALDLADARPAAFSSDAVLTRLQTFSSQPSALPTR